MIEFGLIPEFVGRLPVVVGLDDLDENALIQILTTPKNSLISQYQAIFALDGINLCFDNGALKAIAQKAIDLKIGARGLRTILEESMLDIMFFAPSNKKTQKIVISGEKIEAFFNEKEQYLIVS